MEFLPIVQVNSLWQTLYRPLRFYPQSLKIICFRQDSVIDRGRY